MKYISLIAVAASALVVGCTVATSERVVEKARADGLGAHRCLH